MVYGIPGAAEWIAGTETASSGKYPPKLNQGAVGINAPVAHFSDIALGLSLYIMVQAN